MNAGEASVFLGLNAPLQDKIHPLWAADPVYEKSQKLAIPTLI